MSDKPFTRQDFENGKPFRHVNHDVSAFCYDGIGVCIQVVNKDGHNYNYADVAKIYEDRFRMERTTFDGNPLQEIICFKDLKHAT